MVGQRVFYVRFALVFPVGGAVRVLEPHVLPTGASVRVLELLVLLTDSSVRVLEPLGLPTRFAVRVLGPSMDGEVGADRLHPCDGRHYFRVIRKKWRLNSEF